MEALNNEIVIRAAEQPRRDSASAFRAMAEQGDDELLDKNLTLQTQWAQADWQWQ